jgi:DNA-binding NarL/FixJ family response regulator
VRTSEPILGETASELSGPRLSAVVAAAEPEERMLLAGLVRLHRYRLVGEASGEARAIELLGAHCPSFLIADASLSDGSAAHLVSQARIVAPGIRVILIAPSTPSPVRTAKPSEGPDVTLPRPFQYSDFMAALGPFPHKSVDSPDPI